jgi:hypothetical protein
MHSVNIKWHLINSNLKDHSKQIQMYMFEKGGEIKYIGYSNELSLITEINEYLRLFHITNEEIKIWGGRIKNINQKELTRDLVESAICLIVNQIKPHYNVLCKSGYYGFGNISINNLNCPFIPSNLSVYNTFDYHPKGALST